MLEEKIDLLTKEVVALRKAIEGNGGSASASTGNSTSSEKPASAAKGTRKAAAAKVEPKHDADAVGAIMRQAAKEVDKAAVQKYIKEAGCADLAELLTKPELFDPAYDFASGLLSPADDGSDEEDSSEDDI